jgi:hypothetical protein
LGAIILFWEISERHDFTVAAQVVMGILASLPFSTGIEKGFSDGNPPDKPKAPEAEFSRKEVLHEEFEINRQPDHGCLEAC